MTISASDLKFIASERMIDNLSTVPAVGGGGLASQTLVVDGAENNVFPDVMPGDRTTGVQQLRLIYPTVLSDDNDSLSSAVAGLSARPTDANVEVVAFTAPGNLSSQAAASLGTKWSGGTAYAGGSLVAGFSPSLPGASWGFHFPSGVPGDIAVGDLMRVGGGAESSLRVVAALDAVSVGLDGSIGQYTSGVLYRPTGAGTGVRVSAVSHLTTGASAAADTVEVDKLWAAVQLPGASTLNVVGDPAERKGMLPLYLPGDVLLIQHASTPSTREVKVVESVNYATGEVTFTTGLANAYNTGSKLTRPVPLGVLQAAANNVFSQQTWTRTWSNSIIGAGISSRYSGAIPVTNEGAVTDRWAVVFTSATAFNLISERLGQVAAGSTSSDFLPLNPLTNQPYFTLLATGWGGGWLPGNCVRFNTRAAGAPMWLSRLTKPSSPSGTDQATLFMRGDVDA